MTDSTSNPNNRSEDNLFKKADKIRRNKGWGGLVKKATSHYVLDRLKRATSHDIGIQGEYTTGNVGDRAIGLALKTELEKKGYRTRLFKSSVTHSNARVRILGGGGVIHDWYGVEPLRTRMKYVSNGGILLGVGVPGFRSEAAIDIISEALPELELITVRDERSKDILESVVDVDVIRTADPAFLHDIPNSQVKGRTGINLRPWFRADSFLVDLEDYHETMSFYFDYDKEMDHKVATDQYITNAKKIVDEAKDPIFIPFHPKDVEFANKHLDVEVLPFTNSVEKTLQRIKSVERMVAMRYHAHIFTALCRKPILSINYAPKIELLANELKIETNEPHEEISYDFQTPSRIRDLQEDAEKNIELLESFL